MDSGVESLMPKVVKTFTIDASQIPPPSATLIKTVDKETRKLEYRLVGSEYSVREVKDGGYVGTTSLNEESAIRHFIGYLRDSSVETPGLSSEKRKKIAADLECHLVQCQKAMLEEIPGLKEAFANNVSMGKGLSVFEVLNREKGGREGVAS